jgi:hypothetical protein
MEEAMLGKGSSDTDRGSRLVNIGLILIAIVVASVLESMTVYPVTHDETELEEAPADPGRDEQNRNRRQGPSFQHEASAAHRPGGHSCCPAVG